VQVCLGHRRHENDRSAAAFDIGIVKYSRNSRAALLQIPLRAGIRPLLTSRTVSKVSGTKDDDMFFNSFGSVTRALTSMSSCNFRYQNSKTRQSICSKLYVKMPIVFRMQK